MKPYRILWISLAIIILDHISKWIIRSFMLVHDSIPVIGNFFRITYVENSGIAFSISIGDNGFFTTFAIIASLAIAWYIFKMKDDPFLSRLALAIIFGGACGNLLDRIFRGKVVDFLDFEFFNIHIPAFKLLWFQFPGYELDRWPVFNVADMAITIGMLLLLFYIFFRAEADQVKESESNSNTEMVH
jgi:signal peptidase II